MIEFNLWLIIVSYIYMYIISLLFVIGIFWLWLIYVDRLHLREKCRTIGITLKKYINKHCSVTQKNYIEKYIFYQINAISECIAGFTNGLIFEEPIIQVSLMINKETETNNIETTEVETQTDFEPEIREIIREVEKEVYRDIVVVKEIQIPNIEKPLCIFEKKTEKNIDNPSLDDDNKADYNTMMSEKPKRVKIKQKNITNNKYH